MGKFRRVIQNRPPHAHSAPASGFKRDEKGEQGASLAEFALILPLLIVILFGIIEFGIAFNRAQAVEAAAREGGRLASLGSTNSGDVNARVTAALAGIPITPTVSGYVPCANREGQSVTVIVSAPHNLNIPLWGAITLNLQSQAVFRCEAGN